MEIIKKMILFIKNIFIKQDETEKLIQSKDKEEDFAKSLKVTVTENKTDNDIETLICDGDGLGIQKKITY